MHKEHYPAEIFGYPIENKSAIAENARKHHLCPFNNDRMCSKQSRLLNYPFGICSTWWPNTNPVAICPKRFLQNKIIFIDVAKRIFGSTDNVLLFSEVKLKKIGTFDFALVKHKPISNEIEDFCVVEFQTDSTTGTGKLVKAMKDFMNGIDIRKESYPFGMNTYNTIKLSFIQMLNKGQVFETWKKKIVWVTQEYIYTNMINRFNLKSMNLNKQDSNLFFIYDIDGSNTGNYGLKLKKIESSTIENLMSAFRGADLPRVDDFVKVLHQKLRLNLGIRIQ